MKEWVIAMLAVVVIGVVYRATLTEPKPAPLAQEQIDRLEPAPTPALKHLAPEGCFYMVQYVSARTPKGVVGFEPGHGVHFVSADPKKGTLMVADGNSQVEVFPQQITNDMDIADLARQQDDRSQAQLQEIQEKASVAYQDARRQIDLDHASHVANLHSGSVIGGTHTALDDPAVPGSIYDDYGTSYSSGGSPYSYLYRSSYPVSSLQRVGGGDY